MQATRSGETENGAEERMRAESIVYTAETGRMAATSDADPVVTEVIRHGLNSAAEQMKRALIRTAFSPVIYEVLDFAVAIYDPRRRLLAQAPSLPHFMGTLSFCIERAVEAVGGEDALDPGDVIIYNVPYGTGSHPQDTALVMPVYLDDRELIGYTAIKGHLLDIGGKDPYSTDTIDVFQEGTLYPGVKLYRRGERVEDIFQIVTANTRVPRMVVGDINAEVVGLHVGAAGLRRVVEQFGAETFWPAVERMFDHGEAVVRSYFERIPDGRYVGHGEVDDNGVDDKPVPFEIAVEIEGSDIRVDFSCVPDVQAGPINCPLPETVSMSRVTIMMLAGGNEAPNEGTFRPLQVVARPGSMFHPDPPAPCFLYGWPAHQAMEVVYQAIAKALPAAAPASSGDDPCSLVWWGTREGSGEPWADGSPHPIGQGAHVGGDGASSAMLHSGSGCRFSPVEVWEARNPWLLEKVELAADSCGAGRHRGGLGVDLWFQMLEDSYVTSAVDRTKNPPWGLEGGGEARPNAVTLRAPDGTRSRTFGKATRLKVPKGWTLELATGGGGGFGPPAERDPEAVRADVREGYVSEEHARTHYPHAFADELAGRR